jgi:hypothetical protein
MVLETAKSYRVVAWRTQKTVIHIYLGLWIMPVVAGSGRSLASWEPALRPFHVTSSIHVFICCTFDCNFMSSTRFGWVKRTGKKNLQGLSLLASK